MNENDTYDELVREFTFKLLTPVNELDIRSRLFELIARVEQPLNSQIRDLSVINQNLDLFNKQAGLEIDEHVEEIRRLGSRIAELNSRVEALLCALVLMSEKTTEDVSRDITEPTARLGDYAQCRGCGAMTHISKDNGNWCGTCKKDGV